MNTLGRRFHGHMAAGLLLCTTGTWADTAHVTGDAHVDLGNPGSNMAGVPNLAVSNLTDRKIGERLTFVSYEVAPIPDGASLEQAWLRLWVGKVSAPGTIEFYLAEGPWDEATLTADNAPAFTSPFATVAVSADDEGHFLLLDVTPEVAAWLDGSVANHGFVIVPGGAAVDVSFDSKENSQTSHASELELVLGTASGGIDSEDIADNSIGSDDIMNNSIGAIDVDTSQIQRRVVGTCPEGSSIRVISESGGVTCEEDTDTNSGGDITAVIAGHFLDGGGTSGDVTLDIAPESIDESRIVNGSIGSSSINENQVQRRVNGSCPPGSSIRVVRVNGTVECELDDDTTVDPGLFWQLGGNAGTSPIPSGSNFVGTTDDTDLVLGVNGKQALRLAYFNDGTIESVSVEGGHPSNRVFRPGGTIGGGGYVHLPTGNSSANVVDGRFGTIGGGSRNEVRDPFGFIGGGGGNFIGPDGGGYATIAGGLLNSMHVNSEVSGSSGFYRAFIGGGEGNEVHGGTHSVIVGGRENSVYSAGAFVGGGSFNAVCDPAVFEDEIEVSGAGLADFIGGGQSNNSCGRFSFIGGGNRNVATGWTSMVIGGFDNQATGAGSLAAGTGAVASHDGAFVWSDRSGFAGLVGHHSQRQNQVRFRAIGGVRFDVGDDEGSWPGGNQWIDFRTQASNTLVDTSDFRLIDTSTGAYLSLGGGWVNASDRNLKTAIGAVDGHDVLERLSQMPINAWRYKVEDESIRHIGPMAQDFQRAFGLGGGSRGIMTVDADGVALVAIKALYEVTQQLERRTRQLESQQQRMDALEAGLRALQVRLNLHEPMRIASSNVSLATQ